MPLRPHQTTALQAMTDYSKGQIIVPTGGGKTMCMIEDLKKQIEQADYRRIFVVVAPRILLANQLSQEFLEQIDSVNVLHVHSGETHHTSTTKSEIIKTFCIYPLHLHTIIFTTYHSLHRIQESGVNVDTIYFDEAHNSVQKNFIPATEHFSYNADRCYFFTATPKWSHSIKRIGMNNPQVYGNVICQVPAPKLVDDGFILPPKVKLKQFDIIEDRQQIPERDSEHLIATIDDNDINKSLICARSTKQIVRLFSDSPFATDLWDRGYSWMYITAKTGAVIDGRKVDRETFFNTLNEWGKTDKKFVVVHHSILSEGINVKGLEAVLFMRNMDYITISQSIGRVIRLGNCHKKFGLVCIPVYDKVGISTSRRVQAVVDTVFQKGEPAISYMNT